MSWFLLNRNLTPLEPYDWKLSRTVLRGERGSNAPDLPGKDLSLGFAWSEPLLEKYQDRVSWEDISLNPYIRWTIPMVGKFSKRINWKIFSACAVEKVLTPKLVEAFKDKWDWHELSGNPELHLSYEQMEKYADLLDWVELISEEDFSVPDGKGIDFYEKFREYIPVSKLQGSTLWCEMLEQQRAELVGEIIS